MSEYLAKFIARCGAAARRKAAELVKSGAATVNGRIELDPAFPVDPGRDVVLLAGQPLRPPAAAVYIMLNKPRGYTTSHADAHATHLAVELIDCPEARRLVSAGRLDRESEGLLIFSNDGTFIQHLEHPRYRIHKRYRVTADCPLNAAARARMQRGVTDAGENLRAVSVEPVAGAQNVYLIELAEGKKREIRRMLKAVAGAATLRLERLSVGPVELGDLAPGRWRKLTPREVAALQKSPCEP